MPAAMSSRSRARGSSSDQVNFAQIKPAALNAARELLAEWLPDGTTRGSEWIARNPTRADKNAGSFKINLTTGRWSDFATNESGGDLVSLLAYLRDYSPMQAAKEISDRLGNQPTDTKQHGVARDRVAAGWAPIVPVPKNAPPPPSRHPQLGDPTSIWTYHDHRGEVLCHVARFQTGEDKVIRPLTFCRHSEKGQSAWRWKVLPSPRPLYNLHKLAECPQAPVVIAEGEKAADAAAALLPGYVSVTSMNGAANARYADWTPLAGREVVIWPDADEAGLAYANTVAEIHAGKLASIRIIAPLTNSGEGWDAADALTEGYDERAALGLVASAAPSQRSTATSGHGAPRSRATSKPANVQRRRDATHLIELAERSGIELWKTPTGEAWATVPVAGHREHYAVREARFENWLTQIAFKGTGQAPSGQSLEEARRTLSAIAQLGGTHEVKVRVAIVDGALHIDMGDDARRVIKVTAYDGWDIVEEAPVKFVRGANMRALPEPERGEAIDLLRPFVNAATEDDFVLLVGWLVAAYRPEPPAAILVLSGEQGSAKTTVSDFVVQLVDPRRGGLRSPISNSRELAIAASKSWLLAFDNLSGISAEMSDHLCRLSTGDAFSSRKLHTDDEEVVFEACRPVLINGIGDPISRADLADRAIPVTLAAIPRERRRTRAAIMSDWRSQAPLIFGAILDGLSSALRYQADCVLESYERLADVEQWVAAAEPGLGWQPGSFSQAYQRAQQGKRLDNIDNSPVARILVKLMKTQDEISGTATELLQLLIENGDERDVLAKGFPDTAQKLGMTLSRIATDMRTIGIDISGHRAKKRAWVISRLAT
ncbi:MAG: hypothetical protein AAFX92_18555 [Pseudomonadota bacterium]